MFSKTPVTTDPIRFLLHYSLTLARPLSQFVGIAENTATDRQTTVHCIETRGRLVFCSGHYDTHRHLGTIEKDR